MIRIRCDYCGVTEPVILQGKVIVDPPYWAKVNNKAICPVCRGATMSDKKVETEAALANITQALDALIGIELTSTDPGRYVRVQQLAKWCGELKGLYTRRVGDMMKSAGDYAAEEVGYGVPLGAGGYGDLRNDAVSLTREAIMAAVNLQTAPKKMAPSEELSVLVSTRASVKSMDVNADVAGIDARIAELQAQLLSGEKVVVMTEVGQSVEATHYVKTNGETPTGDATVA